MEVTESYSWKIPNRSRSRPVRVRGPMLDAHQRLSTNSIIGSEYCMDTRKVTPWARQTRELSSLIEGLDVGFATGGTEIAPGQPHDVHPGHRATDCSISTIHTAIVIPASAPKFVGIVQAVHRGGLLLSRRQRTSKTLEILTDERRWYCGIQRKKSHEPKMISIIHEDSKIRATISSTLTAFVNGSWSFIKVRKSLSTIDPNHTVRVNNCNLGSKRVRSAICRFKNDDTPAHTWGIHGHCSGPKCKVWVFSHSVRNTAWMDECHALLKFVAAFRHPFQRGGPNMRPTFMSVLSRFTREKAKYPIGKLGATVRSSRSPHVAYRHKLWNGLSNNHLCCCSFRIHSR